MTQMFWALFKMNICIGSLMLFISEQQKNMLVSVLCFLGSKFEMVRLEKMEILKDELVVMGSILFL